MSRWRTVLEEVVRDRRADLVGYACLYTVDRTHAEDLVQEALVRVFSRTRNLKSVPAAEQYVRRAIRTAFLDHARKRRTWLSRQHLFAATDDTPGPENSVQAGMDTRAALAALSPRQRACTVLRYFDDLPVAEIAAELGISTGAVRRYLSDATAKLRLSLGADADEGSAWVTVSGPEQRGQR